MTQFTYKTDDGMYDVEKLNDTAKVAFNYLAEVQSEIKSLTKRIDVLNAAAKTYNDMLQENLDPEALITEEEPEES
jgi:prefoldin subunit 5